MRPPISSLATHILEELLCPAAYAHAPNEVSLVRTHISWIFFAGEWVYKVKRPVNPGFLDFTRLARRKHFCEEEVRLNSRLSPEMYVGVVPITRDTDGLLHVEGEGTAVEWAVKMKRLPEHRMLDRLLERGEVDNEKMNALAKRLALFHGDAPTGPGIDEFGSPESLTTNSEENFAQLQPYVGQVLSEKLLDFLREHSRTFIRSNQSLIQERILQGCIRDGHGDLHAQNICFDEQHLWIYDCIEFNGRFRCGDVLSDLSFLTMDLDERGYPGFSRYLSWRYAHESLQPVPPELERFYKSYRAIVRAKVSALSMEGLENGNRTGLLRNAMRYIQLAAAYELPPTLVVMCGLPGTGKSWLARRLARPLRASVLQSDVRRKTLAGQLPRMRAAEGFDEGLYAPKRKKETYRSLLKQALQLLGAGHSVILDATYSGRHERQQVVDAVSRLELPYHLVHVTTPEETVLERLERRRSEQDTCSDADRDVYERSKETFEHPIEVPEAHRLEVDGRPGTLPEAHSAALIERMIDLD